MSTFSENNTITFGQFKAMPYFCGALRAGIDLATTLLKLEKRRLDDTYIYNIILPIK